MCWSRIHCRLPCFVIPDSSGFVHTRAIKRWSWIPNPLACQSVCTMAGWHWWRTRDMWTNKQTRVPTRRWWWLAVLTGLRETIRLWLEFLSGSGCGSHLLRHQHSNIWSSRSLSHFWFGQGRRAWHIIGYACRSLCMMCRRHFPTAEQRQFLIWRCCECRLAPRSCHWTVIFRSCLYNDSVVLCSLCWQPILGRGHLCWQCQMT